MACFCKMTVLPAQSKLGSMHWTLPSMNIPVALSVMAAIPPLTDEGLDLQMVATLSQLTLPDAIGMGAPTALFDSLRLALGAFNLTALEPLAVELPLAMESYEQNIMPKFAAFNLANLVPLLKLGQIANLMLTVKANLALDPLTVELDQLAEAQQMAANNATNFVLPKAALPPLKGVSLYMPMVKLAEGMNMTIGETFQEQVQQNLAMLSRLAPPSIMPVWAPMIPKMAKLAAALFAIAAIEEAFGLEALDGGAGTQAMTSTIGMWNNFKLPMPPLSADLSPPPFPDMAALQELMDQLAAQGQPDPMFPTFDTSNLSFPCIPALSASASLAMAFSAAFEIDPFSIQCGLC